MFSLENGGPGVPGLHLGRLGESHRTYRAGGSHLPKEPLPAQTPSEGPRGRDGVLPAVAPLNAEALRVL